MIKFVDLFAGIGGLRKGFEISASRNSFQTMCVLSSEIDERARETYALNYNEVPCGDIKLIDSLPEHNVLLAGFPCQAFSYAGKQKGFADTRGTLFFEIERLLGNMQNRPKLLLLENVRGMMTHDRGRTYQTILDRLNLLGYKVTTLILNSSDFGVPQNRVRLYVVCSLDSCLKLTIKSSTGAADSHKFKRKINQGYLFDNAYGHKCVGDILDSDVDSKYVCSSTFSSSIFNFINKNDLQNLDGFRMIDYRGGNSIHSWDIAVKGECSEQEKELMNAIISNRRKKCFGTEQDGKMLSKEQIRTFYAGDNIDMLLASLVNKGYLRYCDGLYNPTCGNMSFEVFKFLDKSSVSITIVSSDAHKLGVVHNGKIRRITPRECARIQGFTDDFIIHPIDRFAYRQVGNSVSVPVISAIFDNIIENNNVFLENQDFKARKSA